MIDVKTTSVAPYASIDFTVFQPVRFLIDRELFKKLSNYLKSVAPNGDEELAAKISVEAVTDIIERALHDRPSSALLHALSGPAVSIRQIARIYAKDLIATDKLRIKDDQEPPSYVYERPRLAYVRRFRQHLLYGNVIPGPIEVVQSLAPGEKIEVLLEESSSRTYETQIEEENQQALDSEVTKNSSSELAENIQRTLSSVSTTRVGADGGVNFAVWNASASVEYSNTNSDVSVAQKSSKFSQQITTRQSEKIQKRTKLSTRSIEQVSSKSSTRRILENKSSQLMQYGFRRLNYEVVSKVQDLGYDLAIVYQIDNPGRFLARADFADAVPKPASAIITVPKEIQRNIRVQVTPVGDWTMSYKDTIQNLLGISDEQFSRFRDTVRIDNVLVEVQVGRNDWHVGPILANDGSIIASYRSDSTKPRPPVFILNYRLSIILQESVTLPKDIADIIEKYGKTVPELVVLVSKYATHRRRYADGLFEEELGVLLAAALAEVLARNPGDLASVCQLFDEALDLPSAFYVLPKVGTLDASNLQIDRLKSPYFIPRDSTGTQPSPLGSSIGWPRLADVDETRARFLNAPSALLILPAKAMHLESALSIVGLDRSNVRVKQVLDRKERFDSAVTHVAKEDLDPETKSLLHELEPIEKVRPWLDDLTIPINSLKWKDVYPIVSAQNVSVPIDGFAHEELTLGKSDEKAKVPERKPWYCP